MQLKLIEYNQHSLYGICIKYESHFLIPYFKNDLKCIENFSNAYIFFFFLTHHLLKHLKDDIFVDIMILMR